MRKRQVVAFEVNAYKKHEVIQFLMNYLFTDESGGWAFSPGTITSRVTWVELHHAHL